MKQITQRQIDEMAAKLDCNGMGPGARIRGRADDLALIAAELGNDELADRLESCGVALVEVCDGNISLLDLGDDE